MSWEDFESAARREHEGHVFYLVDGDVPVDRAQLRDLYDAMVAEEEGFGMSRENLIVNTINGADDIWNGDEKRDLTYCVTNSFGANKARMVNEMRSATRSWEEVANVRFRYLPAEDGNCSNSNGNVRFSVRPWDKGGACASTPRQTGEDCQLRTLLIDIADIDDVNPRYPNVTTAGVLRHEVGHILGFRHEHIRPEPAGCTSPNTNWRPLTPYDSKSVMHYPQCGGGDPLSSFQITALDAAGVRALYGARSRTGSSGKIASVSRIERHMESLWIAPDGSIQGAWWYAEANAWSRYQLAPPGSASTSGGISLTSRIPTHMEALWIGADGSVRGAFWYSGAGWQLYQLSPAGTASINGGVALVSRTATTLDATWIGADGSVQGALWESGLFPWIRYNVSSAGSAALDANPLLLSRAPGHMEAFWISQLGTMGGAWWYETNPGERLWSPRYTLAGNAVSGAGIGGVSRTNDRMEVFWIGSNGAVQAAKWQQGGSWQTYQLVSGASATGGVTVMSRQPDHMEAFWTTSSGGVNGAWWYDSGNAWSSSYALGGVGFASVHATFAITSRYRNHMGVWWPGKTGEVEQGYWAQGLGWTRNQVANYGSVTTSQ